VDGVSFGKAFIYKEKVSVEYDRVKSALQAFKGRKNHH